MSTIMQNLKSITTIALLNAALLAPLANAEITLGSDDGQGKHHQHKCLRKPLLLQPHHHTKHHLTKLPNPRLQRKRRPTHQSRLNPHNRTSNSLTTPKRNHKCLPKRPKLNMEPRTPHRRQKRTSKPIHLK